MFFVQFYIMAIRTNSLLNTEKDFIIYLDISICIVGGDISVPYIWIQQGAMCPVGCNGALEHAHLTGLEKLVFIIFLKTLDEITVHFPSQDVFDIWIFYFMTEGKQENKMHWFFRTGFCKSVWRNGKHQCHMNHHGHCSLFSTPTPSSSKRQS